MSPLEIVGLAVAAFFAGGINAVAGGGTLIGFPALLAVGYDAKVANVTNTVAIWPGTVSSSTVYLPELKRQRSTIISIAPFIVTGALLGSFLLLTLSNDVFEAVVPFLILGACALLFFQTKITRLIASGGVTVESGGGWPLRIGCFFAALYGGYFGAGLGIILLALFGTFLEDDIQHANALKSLMAMFVNGLASIYFAVFGDVVWEAAAVMALAALAGGFIGARVARKLPQETLRRVAVSYGTCAALYMLFFR